MLYDVQNPHGGDLYTVPVEIDFSANINPYGTPQSVLDAVTASLPLLQQYPDPYCRKLTAAISAFEGVPERYILCGNGAAELIFSACGALHPEKALVLSPCFSEYETALRACGCRVEHYTLAERDDFALTGDFLPVLERFDGQMVMLCNPNNPTGQVIVRELLEEILRVCREREIFLFLDECFLDMTEGGEGLSLKDRLEACGNLMLLKAFTKAYGMAGLRLGYCLCSNAPLLRKMGSTVQAWNVSLPAQMAGIAALQEREHVEKANALVARERPRMARAMQEMGLRVIPSRTNYILFRSERELKAPLLARGLQIRSCANYPGLCQGWYRTAVKLPEENDRLLTAMEEIIHG